MCVCEVFRLGQRAWRLRRVLKAGSKDKVVRVAPRTTEVKQQEDWRLVFVDRPETHQITDCLDELVGENVGFDRDLLSMRITAAACLPVISHEVRLRKVQAGPDLGWASLAQRVVDEEVSCDSECILCPGDESKCRCYHEGTQARNRRCELRRAYLCSRHDGLRPLCKVAYLFGFPSFTSTACWLPAPSRAGRMTQRPQESPCVELLASPDF